MKVTIYGLVNKTTGEVYVGSTINPEKRFAQHFSNLKCGRHHNKLLQEAYNIGGPIDVFIFERKECESLERHELEDRWIERFRKEGLAYNIAQANFGDALTHHPDREAIIKRISEGLIKKNAKLTKEQRASLYGKPGASNGMFGRTHSEEAKERISKLNRGRRPHNLGVPTPEDIKARQRDSASGRVRTGERNPFYGKTHTQEVRRKIAEKAKGRKPYNALACTVNGVEYNSFKEASVAIGVPVVTIRHRCNNDNPRFKDWYLGRKCPERIESTSPQRDGSE